MNTLVIFAHPNMENGSIANQIIINQIKDKSNIEIPLCIRDLYQLYPDFKINVEAEQKALTEADLIVFQCPFHWYSLPGLLKEWLDKVFLYGFAYGSGGNQLNGKEFLISTTIGGPESSYSTHGHNSYTVDEFLKPLQQTTNLAGMNFNTPLVSHNMAYVPGGDNEKSGVEKRALEHGTHLLKFISEISSKPCHTNSTQISSILKEPC
ncbi:MAG: NAD(P)H-dependent oxidoreductase [Bermanella sp.]